MSLLTSAPTRIKGGFEIMGLFGETFGQFEGVLVEEPVLVAAGVFPVGEVLLGDGGGVEVMFEDVLDLGESIEPVEKFGAELAVGETGVELITDGLGETGDFAGTRLQRGIDDL